ncbi:hypothetical protein EJB05_34957, partial [Eragrostis curvula]
MDPSSSPLLVRRVHPDRRPRRVFPLWRRATGALPTPLQRVSLGHVVNVAEIIAAELVERRRLSVVRAQRCTGSETLGWVTPMSVMWLVIPIGIVATASAALVERRRLRIVHGYGAWVVWLVIPLGLAGAGEGVHFPGNMAFYYQEFPKTLRNMATAMAPLLAGLGFYLSAVRGHGEAGHLVAAGEHKPGEAGRRVLLDTGGDGHNKFWLLSCLCQPVQKHEVTIEGDK